MEMMFRFAFYYDFITSLFYLARSFWRGFCNRCCSKVYGCVCNLTRCGKCCGKSCIYEILMSENAPKVRGSLFLAPILHHWIFKPLFKRLFLCLHKKCVVWNFIPRVPHIKRCLLQTYGQLLPSKGTCFTDNYGQTKKSATVRWYPDKSVKPFG